MNKNVLITTLLATTAIVAAQVPHRYYIGQNEVSAGFIDSIPDEIKRQCAFEKWDYDTVVIERFNLPVEYYFDSNGGKDIIARRDDETIASIRVRMSNVNESSTQSICRLRIGDTVPNFNVVKNPGGAVVKNVLHEGKCYLINFWATWCGNCLLELLPSGLPRLAEKFVDDKDFVFLPICIDSLLNELESFFNSEQGSGWSHLEYMTTIDTDRVANSIFAESGHLPLTIVIGKDCKVKYIKTGRISTEEQFNEMERAIISGLKI